MRIQLGNVVADECQGGLLLCHRDILITYLTDTRLHQQGSRQRLSLDCHDLPQHIIITSSASGLGPCKLGRMKKISHFVTNDK